MMIKKQSEKAIPNEIAGGKENTVRRCLRLDPRELADLRETHCPKMNSDIFL